VSVFSHTDWTLICNGEDNGHPCPLQFGPDSVVAGVLRGRAKRAGWAVSVPNPEPGNPARLDYCGRHKHPGRANHGRL
jgi:hypothetical protein